MDSQTLTSLLSGFPISQARWYDRVGSTNLLAQEWAEQGALDLALVAADEQTAGRGRFSRQWITPAGASLAFSLISRPAPEEARIVPRLAAWGALGVVEAINRMTGLPAQIKWPNDVLVNRRKVCGILVEPVFLGQTLQALITGIGVNVSPSALPPTGQASFPPTSLENEAGQPVDRWLLLAEILRSMLAWRSKLGMDSFLAAWQDHLALIGEWITLSSGYPSQPEFTGRLLGIASDGSLRLVDASGTEFQTAVGEIHLRPASPGAK